MSGEFTTRLDQLHHDIVQQGQRVEAIVERAFASVFDLDRAKAEQVIRDDDVIDRVDIEIERRAVGLLAMGETDSKRIRMVLTIVKVNNELERIADLAADIAQQVIHLSAFPTNLPDTLRVMVNSVVGMIRDCNESMRALDVKLARIVLASDQVVEEFKATVVREVQDQLSKGRCAMNVAWAVGRIAAALERMGEHCTNIAEQVIYVEAGLIVRHSATGWSEFAAPDAGSGGGASGTTTGPAGPIAGA